jgi:hypothetical protein
MRNEDEEILVNPSPRSKNSSSSVPEVAKNTLEVKYFAAIWYDDSV